MLSEKDFVDEALIDLKVPGHKGFIYKPTTAGEENDWLPEYVRLNKEGKPIYDSGALNMCRLRNLVEVPVSSGVVQKVLGLKEPAEWKSLKKEQRVELLRALKPGMFDKIINGMEKYENTAESKKKDS